MGEPHEPSQAWPKEKAKHKERQEKKLLPWRKRHPALTVISGVFGVSAVLLFTGLAWQSSEWVLAEKCRAAFKGRALSSLRDPLSLQVYDMRQAGSNPDRFMEFQIDYGAKNGFGGMTGSNGLCKVSGTSDAIVYFLSMAC